MNYSEWTKIDWDGNTQLGYKCYRKSFPGGHVSVGIGDFKLIVYSYGANSGNSLSGTRDIQSGLLTEEEAMKLVDKNKGHYKYVKVQKP